MASQNWNTVIIAASLAAIKEVWFFSNFRHRNLVQIEHLCIKMKINTNNIKYLIKYVLEPPTGI